MNESVTEVILEQTLASHGSAIYTSENVSLKIGVFDNPD